MTKNISLLISYIVCRVLDDLSLFIKLSSVCLFIRERERDVSLKRLKSGRKRKTTLYFISDGFWVFCTVLLKKKFRVSDYTVRLCLIIHKRTIKNTIRCDALATNNGFVSLKRLKSGRKRKTQLSL
jgi:hypothetical protein